MEELSAQLSKPGPDAAVAGIQTPPAPPPPAAVPASCVGAPPEAYEKTQISSELRHELNNQLAVIRMLAEYLAESRNLSPADANRAHDISRAAGAAAELLRKTKMPS
jgi:hypothetical protein